MDHGGESLFNYTQYNIKLIETGQLSVVIWKSHIQRLFKQMVYFVKFLHDNSVCHLDISLENLLIKNGKVINFCDFGLSEYFPNNNFKSNKYCGKIGYQSPEVKY